MGKVAITLDVDKILLALGATATGVAIFAGTVIGREPITNFLNSRSAIGRTQPTEIPKPADSARTSQIKVLKINTNIRGGFGSAFCRWDSNSELERLQNEGWSISGETPLQYATQSPGGNAVFCEGKSVTLSR